MAVSYFMYDTHVCLSVCLSVILSVCLSDVPDVERKGSADWMINGRLSQHITNWSFSSLKHKKKSGTDYLKDIAFGKYFNFVLNLNYIRIVCVFLR